MNNSQNFISHVFISLCQCEHIIKRTLELFFHCPLLYNIFFSHNKPREHWIYSTRLVVYFWCSLWMWPSTGMTEPPLHETVRVRLYCGESENDIASRSIHRESNLMLTVSSDKDQGRKFASAQYNWTLMETACGSKNHLSTAAIDNPSRPEPWLKSAFTQTLTFCTFTFGRYFHSTKLFHKTHQSHNLLSLSNHMLF